MDKKINTYRDLLVWQKALKLARFVYEVTGKRSYPVQEQYGLVNQMRRAAVSVGSNIAEGQARSSTRDFIRFLYMSKGSLAELDTQSTISRDLGFMAEEDYGTVLTKIDELQRMLFSLIRSLEAKG